MSLELPKKEAQEIIWDDSEKYEVVEDEITGTSRWSELHYIVIAPRGFAQQGPWYGTSYSQGLTEYQDERPFEYDGDTILFDELVPVQTIVTKFVTKPVTIEGN